MTTEAFSLPLHCPACNLPLDTILAREESLGQFGIRVCGCSRYPVVAGIPILLHGSIPGSASATPKICALLESGRYLDALVACIYPGLPRQPAPGRLGVLLPSRWVRHRHRLARERHWFEFRENLLAMLNGRRPMTAEALFNLYFGSQGIDEPDARDYFTYRFTQPRHLVALAHLDDMKRSEAPDLDVGCGAGHVTRFLNMRAKGKPAFGVDQNFLLLFLAKHCVAPAGNYVCCDVEEGLPFESHVFDTVVCVNMFHFLRRKAFCASEFKRMIGSHGKLILAGLRQRLMPHTTENLALAPQGYLSLFADMKTDMMDDHDVLEAYLGQRVPGAECSRSTEALSRSELISLVGRYEQKQGIADTFAEWPHAVGRIGINPIYRVSHEYADGSLELERNFPSEFYADENREMGEYLPRAARLDADVTAALRSGRWIEGMRELIADFVLIDLPRRYGCERLNNQLSV